MPIYTPTSTVATGSGVAGAPVGTNAPAASISVAADGLLNATSGGVDIARGFLGVQTVTEPTLEGQVSQLIIIMRAVLLALTATNVLLGAGGATTRKADDMEMADLLTRATRGGLSLVDPNTIV